MRELTPEEEKSINTMLCNSHRVRSRREMLEIFDKSILYLNLDNRTDDQKMTEQIASFIDLLKNHLVNEHAMLSIVLFSHD
jgi:hemerythrin-like domain-containing protein